VYRKRWTIQIEKLTRDKANGQPVNIGFHPSNCRITTLFLDKDRKKLLERKKREEKEKGKYKQAEIEEIGLD
jgi:large subunit ribosomal protein L26e